MAATFLAMTNYAKEAGLQARVLAAANKASLTYIISGTANQKVFAKRVLGGTVNGQDLTLAVLTSLAVCPDDPMSATDAQITTQVGVVAEALGAAWT